MADVWASWATAGGGTLTVTPDAEPSATITGRGRLVVRLPVSQRPTLVLRTVATGDRREMPTALLRAFDEDLEGGRVSLTVRADDPGIVGSPAGIQVAATEVEVWDGPVCRHVGPVVGIRRSADSEDILDVDVGSLWDHLAGRLVGRPADVEQLLVNSSFEHGLTGWTWGRLTETGGLPTVHQWEDTAANGGPAIETVVGWAVDGRRRLILRDGGDGGGTPLALQLVDLTVSDEEGPVEVHARAWARIEDWQGPGDHNFGLVLAVFHAGEVSAQPSTSWWRRPARLEHTTLDERHPRLRWTLHQTRTVVPPGTWTVGVRLSGIRGVVSWDAALLVADRPIIQLERVDVAEAAEAIVGEAQAADAGRTDLGLGVDPTPAGVTTDLVVRVGDLDTAADRLRGMLTEGELEGWWDCGQRTLHLGRRRGTRHPRIWQWGREVRGWEVTRDGTLLASTVVGLGAGDGPTRMRAIASRQVTTGALVERVAEAPDRLPRHLLRGWTRSVLEVASRPLSVDVVVDVSETGPVAPGDLVRVVLPGVDPVSLVMSWDRLWWRVAAVGWEVDDTGRLVAARLRLQAWDPQEVGG